MITKTKATQKIFKVLIHPCVDISGYWAECTALPGCFTDGETVQETEKNMFEAVRLFLEDDFPGIKEYSLMFEVRHA